MWGRKARIGAPKCWDNCAIWQAIEYLWVSLSFISKIEITPTHKIVRRIQLNERILRCMVTFIYKQSNDISIIFKTHILTKRKCFNSSHWKPSWLQTILQSFSHQDSMVLVQKQKYRPIEQNRNPTDKLIHLWASYFWQRM